MCEGALPVCCCLTELLDMVHAVMTPLAVASLISASFPYPLNGPAVLVALCERLGVTEVVDVCNPILRPGL